MLGFFIYGAIYTFYTHDKQLLHVSLIWFLLFTIAVLIFGAVVLTVFYRVISKYQENKYFNYLLYFVVYELSITAGGYIFKMIFDR